MAEDNKTSTESPVNRDASSQKALEIDHATTKEADQEEGTDGADQGGEVIFQLTVNLPHEPGKISVMVSTQEAMHDVRQSIIELPHTFQYSCFHLEHKGQRINDFIQISEVEALAEDPEVTLIEDPYTEKEARLHVIRVREIIGASGDRTDTLHGILSGTSLHDSVTLAAGAPNSVGVTEAHPMASFDLEAPGTLSALLPDASEPAPKTVKAISVSPWNPPPYHLRQKGHLLYIQVTTNEGDQYQITSHISGFYVNKSSNSKFDPFPRGAPKAYSAHSLLNLISEVSPSFEASFQKLLEFNNAKEPLANLQITNAVPANPWIVPSTTSPLVIHQNDITRTQESYLIAGIENTETLRDWNEEFQSTRELPKENVHDRVFRERLTSKLFADYNDAAARGAVLVARGEVAPLNPTEGRDAQIFVYNNIFFSFGADGVGTFASEGGDEAARVATGKDVMGVRMVNQLDIDGLFTPGTVIADYMGKRIVAQSIVPGIFKQREPGENQIDYGAVDGKDVVAANEQFIPTFEKLSKALKVKKHAVWDKDGKRHELEGSVETKGLLGTDGRKYVLDLYRVTPLDISWMEEFGTAIGSADDARENVYPHRMTVLRPELVESYWRTKMREWVNGELAQRKKGQSNGENETKELEEKKSEEEPETSKDDTANEEASTEVAKSDDIDSDRIDISNFNFTLNPDVFSGQEPQTDVEKEEMANDEQEVRLACDFLRSTVLPELISDLKDGDVGYPMDGQSFSKLLHKRGINIRYIGKVAVLAEGKRLESVRGLAIQEMVSRAFKHVTGKYMRYLPAPLAASCVSHLLNCLLGADFNAKPKAEIDSSIVALYPEADLAFETVTPESLRVELKAQISRRYQYTVDSNWAADIKHMQLLREVSLKLGLQLEMKDYRFSSQTPVAEPALATNGSALKENGTNGHSANSSKKKKKARDGSPASIASACNVPTQTFSPDDIRNIIPILKEASPKSALAEEALEAGRISIMQGQKKLGQELLLESLSLHEQIYGILHPEVSRVYSSLSQTYYQLDEKDAAFELARKSVIVSERTIGVDNAETLLNYLNLSLFAHACNETKLALQYVKHALSLWKVIYGPSHPDSMTTLNNAAVMLQNLKDFHLSRVWFEASLHICEQHYGKTSINAATLLFQLAQALALDGDSKVAVNRMREAYTIFLNELGPADKNTKEAESWLEQLTQNAVSLAKHAKALQARGGSAPAGRLRVSSRVSLPQPAGGVGLGQSAAERETLGRKLDSRTIDELVRFIEGTDAKAKSKKRPGRSNPKRRGGSTAAAMS